MLMPIIKYKGALSRVFRKPVFDTEDVRKEGIGKTYSKKLLFLLVKSGKLKRVERGKYTCLDDAVAVAAHITKPSYISLWSALSIRNLTTQIPFSVDVVTSRKRFTRKIDFEDTPIIFHKVTPRMIFGYENIIWKENIRIPVANTEKIIIDAVYLHSIPEEELLRVIKHANLALLGRYAKLTGNKTVKDKVKELIECSRRKRLKNMRI